MKLHPQAAKGHLVVGIEIGRYLEDWMSKRHA
jgi:hypothetical protein